MNWVVYENLFILWNLLKKIKFCKSFQKNVWTFSRKINFCQNFLEKEKGNENFVEKENSVEIFEKKKIL